MGDLKQLITTSRGQSSIVSRESARDALLRFLALGASSKDYHIRKRGYVSPERKILEKRKENSENILLTKDFRGWRDDSW